MDDQRLTVAVTGCTGFVGRHILPKLLESDYQVRALVRDRSRLNMSHHKLTAVDGDLFDQQTLNKLVEGADAVVHLVGIIMENHRKGQTFERIHVQATRNLVEAARKASVKRWIHMSALGTRENAVSMYHQTKYLGEGAVMTGGFDWTIFRPSIIHGPDGEFMQMVKGFCCDFFPPFIPYFGGGLLGGKGGGLVQPVWVEDVARCFVEAIDKPQTVREIYPLGGPGAMSFARMYEICKKYLPGARKWKKPRAVPAWYAKMIAGMPLVPFNKDQVIMSQEDSTCRIGKVESDFGFKLADFEKTFEQYAGEI